MHIKKLAVEKLTELNVNHNDISPLSELKNLLLPIYNSTKREVDYITLTPAESTLFNKILFKFRDTGPLYKIGILENTFANIVTTENIKSYKIMQLKRSLIGQIIRPINPNKNDSDAMRTLQGILIGIITSENHTYEDEIILTQNEETQVKKVISVFKDKSYFYKIVLIEDPNKFKDLEESELIDIDNSLQNTPIKLLLPEEALAAGKPHLANRAFICYKHKVVLTQIADNTIISFE